MAPRTVPTPRRLARLALALALTAAALVATACGGPEAARRGAWRHTLLWTGDAKVQAVAIGEVDPSLDGLEAIAVDYAGRVLMMGSDPQPGSARPIYDHGAKLTGLRIDDLDPDVPGPEVYVGGHRPDGTGGQVLQLVVRDGQVTARPIWNGDGFVHAFARLDPAPGGGAALVLVDYAGELVLARPVGAGEPWTSRVLHREPPNPDPEMMELKDVVAGALGDLGQAVCLVAKSGRAVLLDPARPEGAHVLLEEPGGIARLALAADGSLWLGGNEGGRIFHATQAGGAWTVRPVYRGLDANHGIALGRFPTGDGRVALVAIAGYSGLCRLLLPASGGRAYDTVTVLEDAHQAHWLAAGDLVPDNGADELLIGTNGKQIVLVQYDQN